MNVVSFIIVTLLFKQNFSFETIFYIAFVIEDLLQY